MVCFWHNYFLKSHCPTFVSCLKSVRPEDSSLPVTSHYANQYSLTKAKYLTKLLQEKKNGHSVTTKKTEYLSVFYHQKMKKKKKTKEEIFTCLVLQKQRLKKWFINSGVKHLRDGLVQTESDPRDEESWNVFFLFCDPCSSQLYLILREYLYDIAVFSEVLNNMLSILISLRLIPEVNHFKPMKSGYCIW